MPKRANSKNVSDSAVVVSAMMQSTLLSVLITMLGAGVIGIIMSITDWESVPKAFQSLNYLSVAVGGLVAGRVAAKTGWLHGGAVGILYMLLAIVVAGGGAAFADWSSLWRVLAGFAVGAVGGMLGVNSR